MGIGTTKVRIDLRIQPEEFNKLKDALEQIIGKDYESETFEHGAINPQKHYHDRAESMLRAFEFINKVWPSESFNNDSQHKDAALRTLHKNVELIEKTKASANQSFEEHLEAKLQNHLKLLCKQLTEHWPSTCKDDNSAKLFLDSAEQYQLLLQDCPSIATLSPWQDPATKKTEYIIQYDKRLPAYTSDLLNEFKQLKDKAKNQSIRTPEYFQKLPNETKVFFHGFIQKEDNADEISKQLKQKFEDFNSEIIQLTGEQQKQLDNALKEQTPLNEIWFTRLPDYQQKFIREFNSFYAFKNGYKELRDWIYSNKPDHIVQLKASYEHLKDTPLWYACLSAIDQHFTCYLLEQNDKPLDELLSFFPSRFRKFPGTANFRKAFTYLSRKDDSNKIQFKSLVSTYAGAHFASRDMEDAPNAVQQSYPENNLQHILETIRKQKGQEPDKLYISTKISPLYKLISFTPDKNLHHQLTKSIRHFNNEQQVNNKENKNCTIYHINTPYNAWKYWDYTTKQEIDKILESWLPPSNQSQAASSSSHVAQARVTDDSRIKDLTNQLDNVCNSWSWPNFPREMYISSLMVLIAHELKIETYGSCVSGKDREALHHLVNACISIMRELDPQSRVNLDLPQLAKLVAHLYGTGHSKELASQSGPGAQGIKHPHKYLPTGFCTEIKKIQGEKSLNIDDQVATLIDFHKIPTNSKIDFSAIAERIGEKNCIELNNVSQLLLQQKSLFYVKKRFKIKKNDFRFWQEYKHTPNGIKNVYNHYFSQENKDKLPMELCQKALSLIYFRPDQDGDRTPATIEFYRQFKRVTDYPESAADVIKALRTLYNNSLNESLGQSSSDSKLSIASSSSSSTGMSCSAPLR